MTSLHAPVAFALTCVIFCVQLAIAGFLGVWIMNAVERVKRKR